LHCTGRLQREESVIHVVADRLDDWTPRLHTLRDRTGDTETRRSQKPPFTSSAKPPGYDPVRCLSPAVIFDDAAASKAPASFAERIRWWSVFSDQNGTAIEDEGGFREMIAHISIGVRDIDRSKRFYDAVLEPLGCKCLRPARSMLGYGYGRDSIAFWVVSAEHPVPADEKSGLHFCFAAPNAKAVDAFYATALRAGGRDNGAPGLRPVYGADYYAAFIIDPDGYRIEAHFGPGER
jgi:catechol 2,3-dioxygenase-like lactoylglutathione lyase family enzyme